MTRIAAAPSWVRRLGETTVLSGAVVTRRADTLWVLHQIDDSPRLLALDIGGGTVTRTVEVEGSDCLSLSAVGDTVLAATRAQKQLAITGLDPGSGVRRLRVEAPDRPIFASAACVGDRLLVAYCCCLTPEPRGYLCEHHRAGWFDPSSFSFEPLSDPRDGCEPLVSPRSGIIVSRSPSPHSVWCYRPAAPSAPVLLAEAAKPIAAADHGDETWVLLHTEVDLRRAPPRARAIMLIVSGASRRRIDLGPSNPMTGALTAGSFGVAAVVVSPRAVPRLLSFRRGESEPRAVAIPPLEGGAWRGVALAATERELLVVWADSPRSAERAHLFAAAFPIE